MSLIHSAAHVKLCQCGHHGFIVLADGTETEEFVSQQRGSEIAECAEIDGQISHHELLALQEQITASGLPYDNDQAGLYGLTADFVEHLHKEE